MSHITTPLVAIIVLTWNQCDLTLECLASLAAMDYPSDRLQIIVVDNGSKDGTPMVVRGRFPNVTVLENSDNIGFAEGNNVGIRYAMQGSAEHLMLLNNDTVVDNQMLLELLMVLDLQPDVGIVGPKMLYFDRPKIIWCAGNRLDRRPWLHHRLQADQPDLAEEEQPVEVDYITACGILLRRAVVEQIGLLDPRFFIYYEETDWCLRARQSGWRIVYTPDARLWHKVSAAMGTTTPATDYYMNRNVLLFLAKNRHGPGKWLSLLLTMAHSLRTIMAYTIKPHNGSRLPHRDARLFSLRDAVLGRWGKMGADVAAVCYPKSR